jgi:hypothetical protein
MKFKELIETTLSNDYESPEDKEEIKRLTQKAKKNKANLSDAKILKDRTKPTKRKAVSQGSIPGQAPYLQNIRNMVARKKEWYEQ